MAIFTKTLTVGQTDGKQGTVICEFVFTEQSVDVINRTKTIQIQIYTTASIDGINPVEVSIKVPASEYSWQYDEWDYAIYEYLSASPTKTLRLEKIVTFPLDIDGNSAIWYTVLGTRWDEDEEYYIGTTGQGSYFFLTQEAAKDPEISDPFTLSYNLNGGTGGLSSQTHYGTVTLHSMLPTKEGYRFINWNTQSDGTGISYQPSVTITVYQDLVLYAIWEISTNVPDGDESVVHPTLNIFSVNELDSLKDNVKAFVELNGELAKLPVSKITNENNSTEIQTIKNKLKEINDEVITINNKNKELESDIDFLAKNDAYAASGSGTGWSASDEVAIGTWIDGKTIYRKAWQLNMDARSKKFNVGFDRSNVDVALRMDVMCTCTEGLTPLYGDTSHTTAGQDYFRAYFGSPSNSAGCLCVGGGTSNPSTPYTAIVILEYTKK